MRACQLKRNDGFSLIEILVSIGVVSCLLAVLSSFSSSAFALFSNLDKSQSIAATYDDVRLILKNGSTCTLNLKGTALSMTNTVGVTVPKISQFKDQVAIQSVTDVGISQKGLTLQSMRLVPVAAVDDHLLVTNFEMTFLKFISATNTQTVTRIIPLYANVEGGKVTKCWQRQDQGTAVSNQVCLVISNGVWNTVDPLTGKCSLENGKWFKGTTLSAVCPAGTRLPAKANQMANCDFSAAPGFVDTVVKTEKQLSDGSTLLMARAPAITKLNPASNSCSCAVATDLPAEQVAKLTCAVLCLVP